MRKPSRSKAEYVRRTTLLNENFDHWWYFEGLRWAIEAKLAVVGCLSGIFEKQLDNGIQLVYFYHW